MRRFVQDYIRVLYAHNDGPQAVREFVRKYGSFSFFFLKESELTLIRLVLTVKEAPVHIRASCPI